MTPFADNLAKSAVACFAIAQEMRSGMLTARQARMALRDMLHDAEQWDLALERELS